MSKKYSRRTFGQQLFSAASSLGLKAVSGTGLLGRTMSAGLLADTLCANAEASTSTSYTTALVIGTGYGGAVTALRLAQKGIQVTMLEMGQLWNTPGSDGKVFCNLLQPDQRAVWFDTKTTAVVSSFLGIPVTFSVPYSAGVLDVVKGSGMNVYCGRGVGGGSLVNLAMTITPLPQVLNQVMPAGVDVNALYARYFPLAKSMLSVNNIDPSFFAQASCYQYARVAAAAQAKAGIQTSLLPSAYSYDYMAKEQANLVPRSALGFEASYGNNYGKNSLDKNYLAEALATGLVNIVSLSQVTSIQQEPDGTYLITYAQIDRSGNVLTTSAMACKYLFMGGGSMGTSRMLVKARETGLLPNLNEAVGTRWGTNGDIFVARLNSAWNPTGALQSTIPASGFRTVDQAGNPVFSMNLPLPTGFETWSSLNIVMTVNPEQGSFAYNSSTGQAQLVWGNQNIPAVSSSKYVFDRINAASGTRYRTDLFGGKVFADTSTYHPVGGCPLGQATDLFGRVQGYQRLYINDGSLLPGNLVANPCLTITALAERNIETILAADF